MKIIDRNTIEKTIAQARPEALIHAIETAFRAYSTGEAVVPPVGTLTFDDPPGDVHIKYGYIRSGGNYVIKIASGFYHNPARGLPSSNGLNLVFNKENGLMEAILLDEGYLTDLRTALAGAVAARHLAPPSVEKIGIIGTGIQARLQLRYLQYVTSCRKVMVWGRTPGHVEKYVAEMAAEGWDMEVASDPREVAIHCDLIVTTTPSKEALLPFVSTGKDILITAMGADTIGKQEIDSGYIENAGLIAMDSRSQCAGHGEIHKTLQAGLDADDGRFRELGALISDPDFRRPSGIVVADLTGIATQDIQISTFVLDHLPH